VVQQVHFRKKELLNLHFNPKKKKKKKKKRFIPSIGIIEIFGNCPNF